MLSTSEKHPNRTNIDSYDDMGFDNRKIFDSTDDKDSEGARIVVEEGPISEVYLKFYFLSMGMSNLVYIYVFLNLSDYFDSKYKGYNFNFYSILPTTVAIPLSLMMFLLI